VSEQTIIDRLEHMEKGCNENLMIYEAEVCFRAVERIKELQAQLADAALCFETAAEDIESWGSYASPYFQDKHGLSADVERYNNKANELQQALENNDG